MLNVYGLGGWGEERRSARLCWQWGYMWIATVLDVVGEKTQRFSFVNLKHLGC
jgi:hypothetical protein